MKYCNSNLYRSCYKKDELFLSNKKEIVFVGRSNVGKSSMINKICGRKSLARVSNKPGKTESINFYSVDSIFLVDFPGYGFAKVSKEKRKVWDDLADAYFSSSRNIVLAVVVLDIRRGFLELDAYMLDYIVSKKICFMVAFTKIDKLKRKEVEDVVRDFKDRFYFSKDLYVVAFSSKTGEGEHELKKVFEKFCLCL